ncbi:beta-Ig-H3/fasciclin [Streptomyces sp. NPDC052107]|uniref:beta-Ig-H3/fasciclin n=1 Tax=Streptomyces sp. NPDC052107 TaxID=3155632 RepID=UPI0034411FA0
MNLLRKQLAVVSAAVTAAIGGFIIVAPPAQAAGDSAAAGGTAPACIYRMVDGTPDGFSVYLSNNCGKTMRVKVIVDSGGDSPCFTMSAGSDRLWYYTGVFGQYGRTVTC